MTMAKLLLAVAVFSFFSCSNAQATDELHERVYNQAAKAFALLKCPEFYAMEPWVAHEAMELAFDGDRLKEEWLAAMAAKVEFFSGGSVSFLRAENTDILLQLVAEPYEVVAVESKDGRRRVYILFPGSEMGCEITDEEEMKLSTPSISRRGMLSIAEQCDPVGR